MTVYQPSQAKYIVKGAEKPPAQEAVEESVEKPAKKKAVKKGE